MCNCIELVDAELVEHNTQINVTMTLGQKPLRARVDTHKIDDHKRGRPMTVTATYCPFCGKKYLEGKPDGTL